MIGQWEKLFTPSTPFLMTPSSGESIGLAALRIMRVSPGQELLDRPVISGSCVNVADRDGKELEEFFAGRWAGARDECRNWERIYRNNGKFGI